MLNCTSLFEYLDYHINGIFVPRFHVVLQVTHRRANRTTCPATLIVAWLVNLYIEYLFDISNIVTLRL